MKQILLSDGQFTFVSEIDFLFLVAFNWHLAQGYVSRSKRINRSSRKIRMQNIVATRMGLEGLIDHIDRNKLNNQRSNLRVASGSQNSSNRGMLIGNTSGYKGVTKLGLKWQAQIGLDGKKIYLGLFETPEAAAKEYNKIALQLFGEFAFQNEITK